MEQTENQVIKILGKGKVYIDWANVYGWFEDLGWEIDIKRLFDYLNTYPQLSNDKINFYFGEETKNIKSVEFQERIKSVGYNLVTKKVKFTPVFLDKSHFKMVVKKLFDALDGIRKTNSEISTKLYDLSQKVNELETKNGSGNPNFIVTNEKQLQDIYLAIENLDSMLKSLNINIGNLQVEMLKPVRRRKCDFDVEITMDILRDLDNIDTVILFSGDGDYASLMKYVLEKGKRVRVIFAFGHKGQEYEEDFIDVKGIFFCLVNRLKQHIQAVSPTSELIEKEKSQ